MGYGYHPYDGSRDRNRLGTFFGLMRAWAAGIVVLWLVNALLTMAVFQPLATPERIGSFGWRLALIHLPSALASACSVFAAAKAHPEPYRSSAPLHLAAALTVPIAMHAFHLVDRWSELVAEGIWLSSVAVLAGCLAGVLLDVALEHRHET